MPDGREPLTLSLATVVTRHERTAARTVEGKTMVVVMDDNKLHTLNATGSFLWELCDGRTVRQLVQQLADRYELDEERAQRDVLAFVRSMVEVQALRLGEPLNG